MSRCFKLALAVAMTAAACSAHADKVKFKITNKDDEPVNEIRVGYGRADLATKVIPMPGPLAPGQQVKGELDMTKDSSTWMYIVVVQGEQNWAYRVDNANDFTFKPAKFTFTMRNTCKQPITKVKVGREIPAHISGYTNYSRKAISVREIPVPLPVNFGQELKVNTTKYDDMYYAWEAGNESGFGTFLPGKTGKVDTCKLDILPGAAGKK